MNHSWRTEQNKERYKAKKPPEMAVFALLTLVQKGAIIVANVQTAIEISLQQSNREIMEREIFEEVDQTELTRPANETLDIRSMIKSYPWYGWLALVIMVAIGVTLVIRYADKRTDALIKLYGQGKPSVIIVGPSHMY